MLDNDTWTVWGKHVLETLKEIKRDRDCDREAIHNIERKVNNLLLEFASFKSEIRTRNIILSTGIPIFISIVAIIAKTLI